MKSKPVSSNHPWPLHQLLPSGSCLAWVSVLTSFDDELWCGSQTNSFLPNFLSVMVFHRSTRQNLRIMEEVSKLLTNFMATEKEKGGRERGECSERRSKRARERGKKERGRSKQPLLEWSRPTWQQPGNCGEEHTWLLPGNCVGRVQTEHQQQLCFKE